MNFDDEKVGCNAEGTCGCSEDKECNCSDEDCTCNDEALTVELEDEDGNVVSCQVIDGFLYKDNEYAVVENPDDGSIYLFKVVGTGEVGELVVPDEDEFDEVSAYYEESFIDEE